MDELELDNLLKDVERMDITPALDVPPVALPIDTVPTQLPAETPNTAEPPVLDLARFVGDHDTKFTETWHNLRVDRAKVDSLVSLLMGKVRGGGATNMEVEVLGRALDSLVGSNGHAVRLLDSKSKLISSLKGNSLTVNNNNNNNSLHTDQELKTILSRPVKADDP